MDYAYVVLISNLILTLTNQLEPLCLVFCLLGMKLDLIKQVRSNLTLMYQEHKMTLTPTLAVVVAVKEVHLQPHLQARRPQ
jgi:hypothetical protein